MFLHINNLMMLFQDMQEIICPDDELTNIINTIKNSSEELSEYDLDMISAAGNPDLVVKTDEE